MSPESLKATLIARALHRMANASANLQIVAAIASYELTWYGNWKRDHDEDAKSWQAKYDKAAADLDSLLEPTPL